MANFKEVLFGSEEMNMETVELECFYNNSNQITISIKDTELGYYNDQRISLDKSTAIKLSKILRREIALISEEVNNG